MTAFKLLTAVEVSWRELLPGVIVAAVFWQLLQHLGGFYVDHELKRTGPLYGVFALVLGLLAWLYLGAQLTIFAAEINVVRVRRLWPRSFFSDPLLEADRRALTSSAEVEERVARGERRGQLRRAGVGPVRSRPSPRRGRRHPPEPGVERDCIPILRPNLALRRHFRDDLRSTCARNHRALY